MFKMEDFAKAWRQDETRDTIRSHEGCASFSQNEGRTNFARERECETSAGWYNKLKIEEK
jgi:hypothetical protein